MVNLAGTPAGIAGHAFRPAPVGMPAWALLDAAERHALDELLLEEEEDDE